MTDFDCFRRGISMHIYQTTLIYTDSGLGYLHLLQDWDRPDALCEADLTQLTLKI